MLEMISGSPIGIEIQSRLTDLDWHAPHLIDVEFVSAVRKWTLIKLISFPEAERMLEAFQKTPITRHPHQPLVPRIWALRHNLTPYDASYLALAESLGAPLVTTDEGLRKAASRRLH